MNLISLGVLLAVQGAATDNMVSASPAEATQIPAPAGSDAVPSTAQADASTPVQSALPTKILLPRDTPVHLMTLTEVSTKTDGEGHRFKLRVNEDVILDGQTVILKGTIAWGEVTSAESSGNLGKGGSLTARLLYIDVGGKRVKIEGDTSAKGRTATAETVVGVLSLGLLGLFAKGNNAKIKAGEKITAFIAEDIELDVIGI